MRKSETIARAMAKVLQEAGWEVFGGSSFRRCDGCYKSTASDGDFCSYCGKHLGPHEPEDEQESIELLHSAFAEGVRVSLEWHDNPIEVEVGQVWSDNDHRQRSNPRKGTIVSVGPDSAKIKWDTGKSSTIKLARFRPNSTGYKLVSDA